MRKKTFLRLSLYQTEQAKLHLDEVRSIHREMRAYKHDFHKHLNAIRAQLELGEVDRAIAYIDSLEGELLSLDKLTRTGNVALDAILSGKLAKARSLGVELSVKANIPDELTIPDLELGILVGNLLDNALEACNAVKKPFIRLYAAMKGNMLYFSLTNSSGPKLKKHGRLFGSSKDSLHGFGLKRAEEVVNNLGGWIKFNSEDGAFTSEFLIPARK